jgi:hypothetical protein
MNPDETPETEQNLTAAIEHGAETAPERQAETGAESEANAIRGAEMLETPPDGSFLHGLQLFIAWVKTLVADDK